MAQYDTGEPVFRYLPSEIGVESQQIPSKRAHAVHCHMHRMVISGISMPLDAIRRTSRTAPDSPPIA